MRPILILEITIWPCEQVLKGNLRILIKNYRIVSYFFRRIYRKIVNRHNGCPSETAIGHKQFFYQLRKTVEVASYIGESCRWGEPYRSEEALKKKYRRCFCSCWWKSSMSAEIVGTSPRSGNSVIYCEARFSRV